MKQIDQQKVLTFQKGGDFFDLSDELFSISKQAFVEMNLMDLDGEFKKSGNLFIKVYYEEDNQKRSATNKRSSKN